MSVLYGGDYEKIVKISPKAEQTAKKCTLIGQRDLLKMRKILKKGEPNDKKMYTYIVWGLV